MIVYDVNYWVNQFDCIFVLLTLLLKSYKDVKIHVSRQYDLYNFYKVVIRVID